MTFNDNFYKNFISKFNSIRFTYFKLKNNNGNDDECVKDINSNNNKIKKDNIIKVNSDKYLQNNYLNRENSSLNI